MLLIDLVVLSKLVIGDVLLVLISNISNLIIDVNLGHLILLHWYLSHLVNCSVVFLLLLLETILVILNHVLELL